MNYLLLPENFNTSGVQYGLDIAFLLHIICFRCHTDKRYGKDSLVSLKTEYLREVIHPRKLKKVLTYCEDNGLIEVDHHYIPGGKAKGYGLGYEFNGARIKRRELTDVRAIERLERLTENQRARDRKDFNSTHKYLANVIENRVDYSDLFSLTSENLWWFVALNESDEKCPQDQYDSLEHTIYRIRNEDYTIKVDQNGRFYSPVVELQKETRDLLRVDGEPIYFQDISHTHPALLIVLMKSVAAQKDDFLKIFYSPTSNQSSLSNYSLMKYHFDQELENFAKLVNSGTLYQTIANDLKQELPKVKKQTLAMFYDRPRWEDKCKYTKWFATRFWWITQFLTHYKQDCHKFISNYLLGIEAEIVINRVCHDLIRDHKGIPLITVHDCIGTTEEYRQIVYDKLKTELNRVGVNPLIKPHS